jgi:hypothetical protein
VFVISASSAVVPASSSVIPAKAGIHAFILEKMDPRFRGDDATESGAGMTEWGCHSGSQMAAERFLMGPDL